MFVDTDGRQGLEMAAEKGKSGMKKRNYQMSRAVSYTHLRAHETF